MRRGAPHPSLLHLQGFWLEEPLGGALLMELVCTHGCGHTGVGAVTAVT